MGVSSYGNRSPVVALACSLVAGLGIVAQAWAARRRT